MEYHTQGGHLVFVCVFVIVFVYTRFCIWYYVEREGRAPPQSWVSTRRGSIGSSPQTSYNIIQYHTIPCNTRGALGVLPRLAQLTVCLSLLKGPLLKQFPPSWDCVNSASKMSVQSKETTFFGEDSVSAFCVVDNSIFFPFDADAHKNASELFWICFSFQKYSWHFLIKMNVKC